MNLPVADSHHRCRTIAMRADPGTQDDACTIPRGVSFCCQVALCSVRWLMQLIGVAAGRRSASCGSFRSAPFCQRHFPSSNPGLRIPLLFPCTLEGFTIVSPPHWSATLSNATFAVGPDPCRRGKKNRCRSPLPFRRDQSAFLGDAGAGPLTLGHLRPVGPAPLRSMSSTRTAPPHPHWHGPTAPSTSPRQPANLSSLNFGCIKPMPPCSHMPLQQALALALAISTLGSPNFALSGQPCFALGLQQSSPLPIVSRLSNFAPLPPCESRQGLPPMGERHGAAGRAQEEVWRGRR